MRKIIPAYSKGNAAATTVMENPNTLCLLVRFYCYCSRSPTQAEQPLFICPAPSLLGIGYTVPTVGSDEPLPVMAPPAYFPTVASTEPPLAMPPPTDMHFPKGLQWSLVARERTARIVMVPARPKSQAITTTPRVGPGSILESPTE